MDVRDRARWVLAVVICVLLLIAPAIWNGFPLLQWDTGGYLARTYEGILVPSRAVTYGLLLRAGVPFGFWPVLIVQSALTVWIVALTLRTHGLRGRPWLLVGVVTVLSALTTLPWLTSILLTDIFCGLSVLALYLLLRRADELNLTDRIGLVALIAVAASTHSATLMVLLALLLAAGALWVVDRRRVQARRLGEGAVALAFGAVLVFATNYAIVKRLTWTPGGPSIAFGRMLQDGIVKKYLDDHCPKASLRLCAVKDRIPQDADTWFWGSDLFDSMGRFAGLGQEMGTIAVGSLVDYPLLQLKSAAIATAKQLIDVRTGEGVLEDLWHTRSIIERYTPALTPAMRAAREQRGEITFDKINDLHYPIALLSMALLPLIVWFAFRRRLTMEIGELATMCIVTLFANAVICGVLSNPHDRYGARMVWLAGFTAALAFAYAVDRRRQAAAADPPMAAPALN